MMKKDLLTLTESGPGATTEPPQESAACDVKTEAPDDPEADDIEVKMEFEIGEDALIPQKPTSVTHLYAEASTSRQLDDNQQTDTKIVKIKAKGKQYNECKKCVSKKRDLDFHNCVDIDTVSYLYAGVKPYQCHDCNQSFNSYGDLDVHNCTHTDMRTDMKPYQCDECKKCFKYKRSFNDHIRRHASRKPYQCKKCKNCFFGKMTLKNHKLVDVDVGGCIRVDGIAGEESKASN